MVKIKKENKLKKAVKQGLRETAKSPAKINAETHYETCETRMTAYGGLLAFTKFIDLVKYQELLEKLYCQPSRKAALGCYRMVLGIPLNISPKYRERGAM